MKQIKHFRRTRGAVLVWGLIMAAPPAAAAPSTRPSGESSAQAPMVDRLASERFSVRRQATRTLLLDEDLGEDRLTSLLRQADRLEARQRLLMAARHHALQRMRNQFFPAGAGSLGVSHDAVPAGGLPGLRMPAVQVMATLPGFPAYGRLLPGDLIVRFDDEPLPAEATAEKFREMVLTHPSGSRVSMKVLRRDERRKVTLKLAPAAALQKMYQPRGLSLRPAFRARWDRVREKLLKAAGAPGGDS